MVEASERPERGDDKLALPVWRPLPLDLHLEHLPTGLQDLPHQLSGAPGLHLAPASFLRSGGTRLSRSETT